MFKGCGVEMKALIHYRSLYKKLIIQLKGQKLEISQLIFSFCLFQLLGS
jgi:hypothetical protein